MRYELCDETERLLNGDAANQVDNVVVVALGDLLHHFNLGEEIGTLLPSGSIYGNQQRMLIIPLALDIILMLDLSN